MNDSMERKNYLIAENDSECMSLSSVWSGNHPSASLAVCSERVQTSLSPTVPLIKLF